MINAQQQLISYEDSEWDDFLTKLDLIGVFKPILDCFMENTIRRGVIRYIVWTYSRSSDKVIMDMEWNRNKLRIFEETDLPKEYKPLTVDLKSESILSAIEKWVEFQDEDVFSQILSLKDLRLEMQQTSVGVIKKSSGEIDYDQKFKNAKYVTDLRAMIKDLESELVQHDPRMKSAVKEVRLTRNKFTVGPEKFAI